MLKGTGARRVSLPILNAQVTVRAIISGPLNSSSRNTRPAYLVVRKSNSLSLVSTAEIMRAFCEDPETRVGDLELLDHVLKVSNRQISKSIVQRHLDNGVWEEWILRKTRKKMLLLDISDGLAHFQVSIYEYHEMAKAAPQCICRHNSTHTYMIHEVPEDRRCVYDRELLFCFS